MLMTFAEDDCSPFKQHMYVEDMPEAEDDKMIDAHHLKHRVLTLDSRKIGHVNPTSFNSINQTSNESGTDDCARGLKRTGWSRNGVCHILNNYSS